MDDETSRGFYRGPKQNSEQKEAALQLKLRKVISDRRKSGTRGKILWGSWLCKTAPSSESMQALMHQHYEQADVRDREPLRLACADFDVAKATNAAAIAGNTGPEKRS